MSVNGSPHVVVVEDVRLDLLRFVRTLEAHEASVTTFRNAYDATAYLDSSAWHDEGLRLILLDWKLPGGGASVLQAVRKSPLLEFTPVVVISRSDIEVDVRLAYELGASAYVVKSHDLEELECALNAICEFWLNSNLAQAATVVSSW
jgi:CheY-like chemotaxis protein